MLQRMLLDERDKGAFKSVSKEKCESKESFNRESEIASYPRMLRHQKGINSLTSRMLRHQKQTWAKAESGLGR